MSSLDSSPSDSSRGRSRGRGLSWLCPCMPTKTRIVPLGRRHCGYEEHVRDHVVAVKPRQAFVEPQRIASDSKHSADRDVHAGVDANGVTVNGVVTGVTVNGVDNDNVDARRAGKGARGRGLLKAPRRMGIETQGDHHRTLSYGKEERNMIRRESFEQADRLEVEMGRQTAVDPRLLQSDRRDPHLAAYNDVHVDRFHQSAMHNPLNNRTMRSPNMRMPKRRQLRDPARSPLSQMQSTEDIPNFHRQLDAPAGFDLLSSFHSTASTNSWRNVLGDLDEDVSNSDVENADAEQHADEKQQTQRMRTLRLFLGTWNLNGKPPPPEQLDLFIPPNDYDVYVLGTQECENSIQKSFVFQAKTKWEHALRNLLGHGFVSVAHETLVAIHIIVFVRADIVGQIWDIETAQVATGWRDVIGNKGAVGVSMRIGASSFAFINAHFHAHHDSIEARNDDFCKILTNIALGANTRHREARIANSLPRVDRARQDANGCVDETSAVLVSSAAPTHDLDVTQRFDYVFWMGDLNYRIEGNHSALSAVMDTGLVEVMHNNDQLRLQKKHGRVFAGFSEGSIEFMPTYKFKNGTDEYDSKRVQGWTDRILFCSRHGIREFAGRESAAADRSKQSAEFALEQIEYDSVPVLCSSDHKPVFATFRVRVLPIDTDVLADRSMWHSFTMQRMKTQMKFMLRRQADEFNARQIAVVRRSSQSLVDLIRRTDLPPSSRQVERDGVGVGAHRVVDARRLHVFAGTWNLHGKPPPDDLSMFIPPGEFDLYVLGTEECENSIQKSFLFSSKEKWVRALTTLLGNMYMMVAESNLVALHIIVFARIELLPDLWGVDDVQVPTGFGGVMGNKGGVAVCLHIGRTSLLFVNCHFHAHQNATERRNSDFHKIDERIGCVLVGANSGGESAKTAVSKKSGNRATSPVVALPGYVHVDDPQLAKDDSLSVDTDTEAAPRAAPRASESFDCVLWMGDLNYRINGNRIAVDALIQSDIHQALLNNDQLSIERRNGHIFSGFYEHPIDFLPTYKFDTGTDVYDSSPKKRIPSFTDRILIRDNTADRKCIRILSYGSVHNIRTSDHKPVYAHLLFRTEPLDLFR